MKEIRIKRLCLENFKCHASLTLELDGRDVSIYGDNASGKTSIYDAFYWLLFGKDSAGNGEKNMEIKPLDAAGEVRDHLAVTAVEAVLLVDGEETTLRRTYQEVWTTKRGSSEATYDGNTSLYYVDGVPCKKYAFQDKVNALVGEETFRMLTGVSCFASGISWQERRAALFRLVGALDDRQIMETDERFRPLLCGLGRLSLEDYKKKLLSEKRGYTTVRTEIPARISECEKTIGDTEGLDFAAARAEIGRLTARQEELTARILAVEHDLAAEQKRLDIRRARQELDDLCQENRRFREAQDTGEAARNRIRSELALLQSRLSSLRGKLSGSDGADGLKRQIADARERWIAVNSEVFTGGVCPTCGQELPAQKRRAAQEAFERRKKERLAEIERTANSLKERLHSYESGLEALQAEISAAEKETGEKENALLAAQAAIVEPKDMEGYAERREAVTARIQALSAELADIQDGAYSVKAGLQRELDEVRADLKAQQDILGRESLLHYARSRVESLREDARKAAEQLEALERQLFLLDEFTRYKTRFVEDSINGMFRLARFRLFREQANGGLEDRCDVVYDGVPYQALNNGAKINVGIDIINTLSLAYGVRVPLFIDNAESVTRLEETETQTIRLVVSEQDKELRIDYEN